MRAIVKGPEPPSLTAHRQKPSCNYGNYGNKDVLRRALVTEQRGLCCYCMVRIPDDSRAMKIEHWHCRSRYPGEQLVYRNLLGACLGAKGRPPHLQHCDTRKGDQDLMWNPADPDHHIDTRIRYEADGYIRSDEQAFDSQINQVLNLNLPFLKNNRQRRLKAIIKWWRGEKARLRGPVPRSRFERERDRRIGGTDPLESYCQIAVWWLDQRLTKMLK